MRLLFIAVQEVLMLVREVSLSLQATDVTKGQRELNHKSNFE